MRVIPHGVAPPFEPVGPAAGGDYALAVGTVEPRKNLVRAQLAAERAGVELRVVGPPGWGDVGVTPLGFVDDEELARLYRGSPVPRLSVALRGFRAARCSRRWRAELRS